jgi:FtsZ-interacting cell division protein ZipA
MEALLWLLLEAGVALLALLFIVWWTWPRRRSRRQRDAENGKKDD